MPYEFNPTEELPEGITRLIHQWGSGQKEALDELMDRLYQHLRNEAARHLRNLNVRGNTLQPTLLVNEAYLKLRKRESLPQLDKDQFFWFASRVIRQIIIDHIRARLTRKRNKDEEVPLDLARDEGAALTSGRVQPETLLALDRALGELENTNPRRGQIVVLRFILGTSIEETAKIMGLSLTTVKEEWRAAKIWLFKQLASEGQAAERKSR